MNAFKGSVVTALFVCGPALALDSSFSLPSIPSTPVYTPPPQIVTPQVSPVVSPPMPPVSPVGNFAPMIPTDFTNLHMGGPDPTALPTFNAAGAVQKTSKFPDLNSVKQDESGILVKKLGSAEYTRPSLASVNLSYGSILVSVRRPARLGIISTPQGDVSVAADADVIIVYREGVLRVMNLTGPSDSVKLKVHSSGVSAKIVMGDRDKGKMENKAEPGVAEMFGVDKGGVAEHAGADKAFDKHNTHEPIVSAPVAVAVKVGHELVSSDHALTRHDLQPHDGIGRRRFAFVETNVLAVSEFSLESVLTSSDLLVDMAQTTDGLRERRIMGDLSKMAAVLNYMNGGTGYVALAKDKQ